MANSDPWFILGVCVGVLMFIVPAIIQIVNCCMDDDTPVDIESANTKNTDKIKQKIEKNIKESSEEVMV